ncbi:peptidoglycan-binding protein [Streptomyces sp. NBC_00233]|uniref:peptidoglycan-binding protein n=1 Tax=Streptomyces sp. NBC_00233 TaxID=2975686 RepID=UPI0022535297|nr:peptidoglycan-binding protein [Streptomyces sp. NBC_00233]MCX5233350.1 peptidoglycan-binding protein [Streptomyces sp. NBC_00233]
MDGSLMGEMRIERPADGEAVPAGRRASRGKVRGRRWRVSVGAAVVVTAAVTGAGALGLGGGEPEPGGGEVRPGATVKVTRGALAEETAVKGELGHGPEVPLSVNASGTVTWLPDRGTTVKQGQAVLRVDDRPVVLLYGALPMYRDLGVTVSDGSGQEGAGGDGGVQRGSGAERSAPASSGAVGEARDAEGSGGTAAGSESSGVVSVPVRGADVRQFETNLAALGYTGFTVDDTFSALTAQAVKRWQKALGMPPTGTVKAGDVAYAAGPVRIARTDVRVGAEMSAEAVSYSSMSRMVTVEATAADMAWAHPGNAVTVELPSGTTVVGKVSSVGTDASPAEGASGSDGREGGAEGATVPVVITFADQKGLGRLESGPVTVRYVGRERKDVLTVPVVALVALAEGGYGLEPADAKSTGGDGAGGYVAVTTGLVADGKAEVSGPGLREGMTVRIPK